jgi:uncharacterized protein YneF (UPF0154 family)
MEIKQTEEKNTFKIEIITIMIVVALLLLLWGGIYLNQQLKERKSCLFLREEKRKNKTNIKAFLSYYLIKKNNNV